MRCCMQAVFAVGFSIVFVSLLAAHDGPGKGDPNDKPQGYGSSLPYSGYRVRLMSQLSIDSIGGGTGLGSAIWGWTDSTDPTGPREYAVYGLSNGTSFIDVTDPSNPVYKGFLPSATGATVWREVQTYGNHALIVSDANGAHGMQVFDMRELRNYVGTPMTFSTTPSSVYTQYTGVTNSHTIRVNEDTGYAYLFGTNTFSGGVHAVDISSPMSPTFAGGYAPPTNGGSSRYVHDGQAVLYNGPDQDHVGKEIVFAANARTSHDTNDDTVTIIDATNKASMSQLGAATHPDARYIHQGWLTPDQEYFLVNDELDEYYDMSVMRTHVFDVRDLDAPVYAGSWTHPVNAKNIDHNLFIKDTPWGLMAFQSNYTLGLRIIRLDNLGGPNPSMFEFAWFDTYPADDGIKSFNGQWGNYPFFESGTIIAGDRQNGLFVLQMVPEPSTWAVMVLGTVVICVITVFRRRRHKSVLPS